MYGYEKEPLILGAHILAVCKKHSMVAPCAITSSGSYYDSNCAAYGRATSDWIFANGNLGGSAMSVGCNGNSYSYCSKMAFLNAYTNPSYSSYKGACTFGYGSNGQNSVSYCYPSQSRYQRNMQRALCMCKSGTC